MERVKEVEDLYQNVISLSPESDEELENYEMQKKYLFQSLHLLKKDFKRYMRMAFKAEIMDVESLRAEIKHLYQQIGALNAQVSSKEEQLIAQEQLHEQLVLENEQLKEKVAELQAKVMFIGFDIETSKLLEALRYVKEDLTPWLQKVKDSQQQPGKTGSEARATKTVDIEALKASYLSTGVFNEAEKKWIKKPHITKKICEEYGLSYNTIAKHIKNALKEEDKK